MQPSNAGSRSSSTRISKPPTTSSCEVFGLGPGELTRDEAGDVVHVELQAGDGVVWLHPESPEFGLASPRTRRRRDRERWP